MATYASLTQADKDLLAAWEREARALMRALAKAKVTADVLRESYIASDGPQSIVATLDAGQDIPNTGGLSGAQDLQADTEWATMITVLNDFRTDYDTAARLEMFAKAAGVTAGLE